MMKRLDYWISETNISGQKRIWTGWQDDSRLRQRIIDCFVWSVALYAPEMWTDGKRM